VTELRVPKLNNNDDEYTLVEWVAGDGKPVTADEVVVTVETSKATEDLLAPTDGVLWHGLAPMGVCRPGDVIGEVAAPGAARSAPDAGGPGGPGTADGPVITAPARELMTELGVNAERLRELDVKIVRREDVRRLVEAGGRHRLPPVQQAVARAVTESHRTVPAAYTVVQVPVDAALSRAGVLRRELRKLIGLPEFVITAVARSFAAFPLPFATPVRDGEVRPATAAHIGVTMDVGRGLYVPVIADASGLDVAGVAEAVGRFRRTAVSGAFRESELSGGNLTVALHNDSDVVFAVPFVFPGTLCTLAVAGPREELVRDAAGEVVPRTVVNLGLAYDHRFVNGRDAAMLLQHLKDLLGDPVALERKP
jgi:2-oxoglutarate dehydrogenase E2 component (dihydrolipoamide succinyltransferase)